MAITALAVFVVGPAIGANAAANPVDPCDAGQTCDPVVTVTVTQTPGPTSDPVVTKTVTVTPTPTVKPTKTKPAPATTTASQPTQRSTLEPDLPASTAQPSFPATTAAPATSDPAVVLPGATPLPSTPSTTPTTSPSFEEPAPESVPIEIRNATPQYDKVTLSQKLAIPGAVLVLVVLLAWLVFEGRLRRMAHAAAVRRAGPQSARGGRDEPAAGYPAGQGYAPMVGFVPVQYAMGYPQQPYGYPAPYGYPQAYGAQGYPMDPSQGVPPGYVPQGYAQPGYTQPGYAQPGFEGAGQQGEAQQGAVQQSAAQPDARQPAAWQSPPVDAWGPAVGESPQGVWGEATDGPAAVPPHGDASPPDRTVQYPLPGDPSSADGR
ncbi:hypothetical protein [Microbispora sp. NPDC049125]|uniref:hypothetical protein n=1 Tax=Microbispora sp. NPDC049125 TaxID=3154929 RepID=UPI0034654A9F